MLGAVNDERFLKNVFVMVKEFRVKDSLKAMRKELGICNK